MSILEKVALSKINNYTNNKTKLKGTNIEPSTNLESQQNAVNRFLTVNNGDSIALIFEFSVNKDTNVVTEGTANNTVSKQLVPYIQARNGKIIMRLSIGSAYILLPQANSFGTVLYGDRYDSLNNCYDANLSAELQNTCYLYWAQQYAKYCIDNNIDTMFITNEWVNTSATQHVIIQNFISVLRAYCTSYNSNFILKLGITIATVSEFERILKQEQTDGLPTILEYVDIIGYNYYPQVKPQGISNGHTYDEAEIKRNVLGYSNTLYALKSKYNKPIYITEIGCCANQYGIINTADPNSINIADSVQSDATQALYYENAFKLIYDNYVVDGIFLFIGGLTANMSNKKGYQWQERELTEAIVNKYYGGDY